MCMCVYIYIYIYIYMSNISSSVFMFNDESKNAEGRFNLPVVLRFIIPLTSCSNNLPIY
jgi:hypothetical protein